MWFPSGCAVSALLDTPLVLNFGGSVQLSVLITTHALCSLCS